ncbi:MAG: hypothetical protein QXE81_03635 [Desulfurococcaceae archaeon]
MDLLALAFYLSILSYSLGLLLKAIPLPFLTLKKLGRSVVNEGIFSAVLILSYRLLVDLIDFFGRLLGSSWLSYINWLYERSMFLLTILASLKTIGLVFSKAGLGFLAQVFINPVANVISTSLITVTIASIVSTIFHTSASSLIAIGLVFHAVPFKLTRNIGATLIAVTIVFSIALPLMPTFINYVSSMAGIVPLILGPYCTAEIKLLDSTGKNLGYGVVESFEQGELIYRYSTDQNGVIKIDRMTGFPCSDHTMIISIGDQTYLAQIPVSSQDKIDLSIFIPNIVSIRSNRFVLLDEGISVINATIVNKTLYLILYSPGERFVKIYTERNDTINVFINNEEKNSYYEYIEKHGISYAVYRYKLPYGNVNITVQLDYLITTPASIDQYPYIAKLFNERVGGFERILIVGSHILVELTILPLIYLSILMVVSLNAARLLGGAYSSITRYLVGY